MSSRPYVLGIDCALYYMPTLLRSSLSTIAGFQAAKSADFASDVFTNLQWIELEPIKDVTLNLSGATWDATTRASNRWRQMVQTLSEGTIEFQILWLPDDLAFAEMLSAYESGCGIAMLALDASVVWPEAAGTCPTAVETRCGTTGYKVSGLFGDFSVTNFSRSEALEEGVVADVSMSPTKSTVYPVWIDDITTATSPT